jgi:integrase
LAGKWREIGSFDMARKIGKDMVLGKQIRTAAAGAHVRVDKGLYLHVQSPDAQSWLFRYMLHDRRREMGLGSYPAVTLALATAAADAARASIAMGVDPLDQRAAQQAVAAAARAQAAARAVTFGACAADYIATHRLGWKNTKHASQWENTLRDYAMPVVGHLPVADVGTGHLLEILGPIWTTKHETASRVRNRIELILDAAKAKGLREGENPARLRGHLDKLLPKRPKADRTVRHHPALSWRELPAFWADLSAVAGVGAEALRFTILTAARTGETIGATWDEIDIEARTWTIPAVRMKAGADHRVPLSPEAVEILQRQRDAQSERTTSTPYVFAGKQHKPISNMAMAKVLERMGRDTITVHGFRSTFRDWIAEATSHPRELAEKALAHKLASAVEAAYQRADVVEKRREVMSEWSRYATGPSRGANVVPMRLGGASTALRNAW